MDQVPDQTRLQHHIATKQHVARAARRTIIPRCPRHQAPSGHTPGSRRPGPRTPSPSGFDRLTRPILRSRVATGRALSSAAWPLPRAEWRSHWCGGGHRRRTASNLISDRVPAYDRPAHPAGRFQRLSLGREHEYPSCAQPDGNHGIGRPSTPSLQCRSLLQRTAEKFRTVKLKQALIACSCSRSCPFDPRGVLG